MPQDYKSRRATHTTIASDQRTRRAKRQRQLLLLQVYMTSRREDRSFVRNFRSVRHVPSLLSVSLSPLLSLSLYLSLSLFLSLARRCGIVIH